MRLGLIASLELVDLQGLVSLIVGLHNHSLIHAAVTMIQNAPLASAPQIILA